MYVLLDALLLTSKTRDTGVRMSEESSSEKGFNTGRKKGGMKGPSIVWKGSVGSESYSEAVYEFSVESKGEFTKEKPRRGYDDRKEDWPKCMYDEDCLVQMRAEGMDGGRRFFKCPRAWIIITTIHLLHMFLFFYNLHEIFVTVFRCSRKLEVR
jgi:hypothetical protein